MKDRHLELLLSFATLVLIIIAITIFIYTGGSLAFYAVAVVAVIVGFANAFVISRIGSENKSEPKRRSTQIRSRRTSRSSTSRRKPKRTTTNKRRKRRKSR